MNCVDARKVWSHPEGPIVGIQTVFPEAWKRIHSIAHAFEEGLTNPFNEAVHTDALANGVRSAFYAEHADDNDPVAEQVHGIVGDAAANVLLSKFFSDHCNVPMKFGNACCSSCQAYPTTIGDDELIQIQIATIKNNP